MKIDGTTRLYGIIGNPVGHSLSPVMHNAAFDSLGENRVYLPFEVEDLGAALYGMRALGIEGASVTIPHKEAVLAYLDRLDPVAEKIGAVNTIRLERSESTQEKLLCGYNTDWLGAVRPLQEQLELRGKSAIVLGAGGSARAIGFGLLEAGAALTLCSRTESRGRALASALGCDWSPLAEAENLEGDILINATSVGMSPFEDKSPVAPGVAASYQVVMDIVYAPLTTRLLADAQLSGCRVVGGLEMLLQQGAAQFELWTSLKAPVDIMRRALLEAISPRP